MTKFRILSKKLCSAADFTLSIYNDENIKKLIIFKHESYDQMNVPTFQKFNT